MTRRQVRTRCVRRACGLAAWLLVARPDTGLARQPMPEPAPFGATYDALTDEQRGLLDGFFRRASAVLGATLDPRERYDGAPLSSRTTFGAVTHALFRSTLSDRRSGEALGRAIDLIDVVEGVRGQVKGAAGDQQFRIYVALKPGARETLDRAREFRRTADNAFFHQGYPMSYRQDRLPSVQMSLSADAARADIDVDYRSARFPVALVNGHLSAANSDVRAGNVNRHNERWSGLVNWWDGVLGPLFAADVDVADDAPRAFPSLPRAASKTIDVAVDDFLRSWLVEGQANLAVAYVDPAAYDCLATRLAREGQSLDRGLASLQLFVRMKAIGELIGRRQSLAGTTRPVRLPDPALRVVDHRQRDRYAIYAVPEALAGQWSCASGLAFGQLPATPARGGRPEAVYETFYSTLALDRPDRAGAALGLLWQRRDGLWKIVAYQAVWDDGPATTLPDLHSPDAPAGLPATTADAALLQANDRFLDGWLIRKDVDGAMGLISSRAYGCVNLYLDPDEPPKATPGQQLARLRAGLERVGMQVGAAARLDEVIASVEPSDRRFGLVDHPKRKASCCSPCRRHSARPSAARRSPTVPSPRPSRAARRRGTGATTSPRCGSPRPASRRRCSPSAGCARPTAGGSSRSG
jgi:hypothetical protein